MSAAGRSTFHGQICKKTQDPYQFAAFEVFTSATRGQILMLSVRSYWLRVNELEWGLVFPCATRGQTFQAMRRAAGGVLTRPSPMPLPPATSVVAVVLPVKVARPPPPGAAGSVPVLVCVAGGLPRAPRCDAWCDTFCNTCRDTFCEAWTPAAVGGEAIEARSSPRCSRSGRTALRFETVPSAHRGVDGVAGGARLVCS